MRGRWLGLFVFLGFVDVAVAADQFLCVSEQSTGFRWKNGSWRQEDFKVGEKYLVVAVPEYEHFGEKVNYEIRTFGSDKVEHRCRGDDPVSNEYGTSIMCGGVGYGLRMDTKTMRFQEVFGLGYVEGWDKPESTPAFTIGTCSRLN